MNDLLAKLYSIIPKNIINYVGKKESLKFFRNIILKNDGSFKIANVLINKVYINYLVKFNFYASIKTASKGYKTGIENKVIRNSINLLNKYKSRNNDNIVLDIGANFGYLSLVWARTICKNQGKVFAFEPNFKVFETFNKSINSNDLNNSIMSINKAVGSENKKTRIYLSNTSSNMHIHDSTMQSKEIDMTTIDNYLKGEKISRCDLIKIDVDGIELDILQGCLKTLVNYRPIFVVETNNDRMIIDFFIGLNYRVLNMELEQFMIDDILPLNIFCVPN